MLAARSARVSTGIPANLRLPEGGCGGVREEGAGIPPCRGFGGVPQLPLFHPPRVGARGLKAWFRDKLVLVSLAYYGYD